MRQALGKSSLKPEDCIPDISGLTDKEVYNQRVSVLQSCFPLIHSHISAIAAHARSMVHILQQKISHCWKTLKLK